MFWKERGCFFFFFIGVLKNFDNVGSYHSGINPFELSINNLKDNISGVKVEYVDSKIMNQLSYHVSNLKIKAKGFNFNDNLIEGINRTLSILEQSRV